MAASSFTNLWLCNTLNFSHSPKILHSKSQISLKPNLSLNPTGFQKPLFLCSEPLVPLKPTSNFQLITSCLSHRKSISKVLTEKIVTLLLGSFIFMGCLKVRHAMALPANQGSVHSESMEEKREEQGGKTEDEEMCVKLLEQNPRDVEALKMVVNVMMKRGKTKDAVGYVEKLIEIQPNEVEWRLLQALCYELMGQFSKAKKLFKDILKQRPLLLRALHGLAMVMHKNHEGPAVFQMLEKAQEVAHRDKRVNEERNIRILIAQMHVVKGELEEALENFQTLVNENPRDFRPYLCQGIIYSLLDKKEEAKEQFEIYQSLVPDEFPQRKFLDDVVLAAKTESKQQLQKEFKAEFS